MEKIKLNTYIDHTLLKAEASPAQIIRLCQEARQYQFASCCVNTGYAALVHKELEGSGVKTCCVIGFPLGAMSTASKVFEAIDAIEQGAEEIDMVMNIGWLKSGHDQEVLKDIRSVRQGCGEKALLKVIIECCLLTREEKIRACKLAVEGGADFVKTSTGFSTGGATVEDVRLMKETVGDMAKVKASGGIHSREEALAMIHAGASRIGASAGVSIINQEQGEEDDSIR